STTEFYTLSLHDALPILRKILSGVPKTSQTSARHETLHTGQRLRVRLSKRPRTSILGSLRTFASADIGLSRSLCGSRNGQPPARSEEHTSELQSRSDLVC